MARSVNASREIRGSRRVKDLIKSINEEYSNREASSIQDARQLTVLQKKDVVEGIICHRFADRSFLAEALRVPGVPRRDFGIYNISCDGNKRLAWVGDAVIWVVLAEDWYVGRGNNPVLDTGQMPQLVIKIADTASSSRHGEIRFCN